MLYFHNMFIHKKFLPDVSVETKSTLQETNISHPKALLKRTFLSPRSDMLVPRNVCMDHQVFGHVYWMNACVWPFSPTQSMFVHTHHPNEYASIFLSTFSCQVFFGILFISYTIYIYIYLVFTYTDGFTQPFLAASPSPPSSLRKDSGIEGVGAETPGWFWEETGEATMGEGWKVIGFLWLRSGKLT